MNKILAAICVVLTAVNLTACGGTSADTTEEAPKEEHIIRIAESFAHTSLDPHVGYQGWYASVYGIVESLFRLDENQAVQSCLAEDAVVSEDGLTWMVTLREGVHFSNGEALLADMAVRNLLRAAEQNERFAYLGDFQMQVVDDRNFTIITPDIYPTMKNDLASPELAMIDLDHADAVEQSPIGTGPFIVTSFEPEGTVEVARNENYWNGEVKLDGAVIYYMPDDDAKLMALQNGEIDAYTNVSASALDIFLADPDTYRVVSVPTSRLQFYIYNQNTLSDVVREAISLSVDHEAMAAFLNGTVETTDGPFSNSTAYGKVNKPQRDLERAKMLLEEDGYQQNAAGFYEKDGETLTVQICYYPSRSLDTIALLMQEQLKGVGIDATLTSEEDPDGTYIATGDFDIALYCMISDKAGDPYYFIDSTLRKGSYFDCGGFEDAYCEELINELKYETDVSRRAELATEIIQIAVDDRALGFVGMFNKITVFCNGAEGYSAELPFDFYGMTSDTDIP